MVLYYSGTGNSKFIAKCIASALETDCLNLNERIKAEDTSSVQTEENVILVTPTYCKAKSLCNVVLFCLLFYTALKREYL